MMKKYRASAVIATFAMTLALSACSAGSPMEQKMAANSLVMMDESGSFRNGMEEEIDKIVQTTAAIIKEEDTRDKEEEEARLKEEELATAKRREEEEEAARKKAEEEAAREAEKEQEFQQDTIELVINWVNELEGNYDDSQGICSVLSGFTQDTSEEEAQKALVKFLNIVSTDSTGYVVSHDDNGFLLELSGNSGTGTFPFVYDGEGILMAGSEMAIMDCDHCDGYGVIVGGYNTCPICGGAGQQYIPNAVYDNIMGWQGIWQACSGCAGTGQQPVYDTCAVCRGTGVN